MGVGKNQILAYSYCYLNYSFVLASLRRQNGKCLQANRAFPTERFFGRGVTDRKGFFFFDKWSGADKHRFDVPPMRTATVWGNSLFLAGGLLGQKNSLDVGQDTTLGDGDTGEELVQLFVVPHGELEMTRDNPGLLVVSGGVTGQLEDLGCQVLHDSCEVDWSTSTYALSIVALAQKTVNTSNGELQTRTG